uniref:CCHC-type domain-containing protein n=1 Tax=Tanacetum cinerariifolium TaxID=118510 RepID=A0A699HC19_TANCI|nr:hypothetical protein [Tanacetum cinerariifolium]
MVILTSSTDNELTEKELKQIEADDQAIQTILLGLSEDIYAAVDSCETAQESWLRRNKHFPEKIANNLKFLNNLQPEWSRHVTIVYQTKDLHIEDYTQLYDFPKYNQKEVDDLKAERLAKTHDPLALMVTSNTPYTFLVLHQDQPSFNQNYMQQPMPNLKDITDPTTAMNMALALMAKAFKLNYSTPTNNNQRISSNPRNRQIAQPGMNMGQDRQMQMVGGNGENRFRQYAGQNVGKLNGYNDVQNVRNQNPNGNGNLVATCAEGNATGHNGNQGYFSKNYTVRPRRKDAAYLQTQLLIAQKEEAGIQLQAEEFDLMAAAVDLDKIEEVNANCILMANLQQALTSGTQSDKAPVYDSDGSAKYTELLEPIPEPHHVPQNDNNVIYEVFSVEQSRRTVEQHPVNVEETRVLYDSLYNNLAIEVEKVNTTAEEKKTRKIDRLARSLLIQGLPNDIYSLFDSNKTAKDLWDALERHMRGSEYGEKDRKAAILYEYETFKATKGEQLLDTYLRYLQVINDLKKCGYKKDNYESNYKFLNNLQPEWKKLQNQGDVNEALGYKKKAVVVTSDPLALVAEKTKVSKRKEKVKVQTESEVTSYLANKKPEYVKSVEKKEDKKADEKKRDMSKVKCYNCKKEGHFAKDCKKAKEINANMVLMAQIEKVLSNSDESSSSAKETIVEVAYYTSESKKIFHDAIASASENFIENHIDSQKDYNKFEVDHNDSEETEHLVNKLIKKFYHNIPKCKKCIEKVNQQSKDLENQNKDLQEKYDVLINQVNNFEEQNNEFNKQIKVLKEKNPNLLAQTKVLQDQLKVKHVVIDTHTECQAQYAKLEEERYEYMIRYSALCDNDKQHRKKIKEQEILFDKMSRQLVKMNNNVLRL